MGLRTSPNSFQLLMDKVLHGLKFQSVLCYLDDILIFSETFESHLNDLKEVFSRLREAGLKLGPSKCRFAKQKCNFLGHEISKDGIRPPAERITAIENYPPPKNLKELRRLLGLFNWFKKFIPNYSAVAFPLFQLTKKIINFRWGKDENDAFEQLKFLLVNSRLLAFPNLNGGIHSTLD